MGKVEESFTPDEPSPSVDRCWTRIRLLLAAKARALCAISLSNRLYLGTIRVCYSPHAWVRRLPSLWKSHNALGELVGLALVCGSLDVRRTVPARSLMGLVTFLVLMSAEVGLGAVLGRSLVDQLATYGSLAGAIGLAAQVIFAMFPVFQGWRR